MNKTRNMLLSYIMTDVFSDTKRSQIMSHITSKNTSPELKVRKILTSLGIKYRLHSRNLPGKPDISNKKMKVAIFVNGCFWHQHKNCKRNSTPKTNQGYWLPKLKRNVEKQKEDLAILEKKGWKVIIIWECETKNNDKLLQIIKRRVCQN